ncbi:MAG TPA: hypothetical protein VK735_39510 [Pseudonocardia sp.]|uniref:hypothetical protein n=1 Tax=Pseudonocardia sp. TaxID=60912 RepID=UPI002B712AE5|nr:hypothetical protein [Pseudonocardia sp.]HTF53570.1 hypothetical protein [Pseudonocardia sp.]
MARLTLTLRVDVDLKAWANEYGLDPAEVEDDVIGMIPDMILQRARELSDSLGTFTVPAFRATTRNRLREDGSPLASLTVPERHAHREGELGQGATPVDHDDRDHLGEMTDKILTAIADQTREAYSARIRRAKADRETRQ